MTDDRRVYRCSCGAWAWRGRPCPTCVRLAARRYTTTERTPK